MLLKRIEQLINVSFLKEDARKVGVNFITAGVVGVFINHFVGSHWSSMFWASLWITSIGFVLIFLGLIREDEE